MPAARFLLEFAAGAFFPPGVTVTDVSGSGVGAKRTINNLGGPGAVVKQQVISVIPGEYITVAANLVHPKPEAVGTDILSHARFLV